MFGWFKNLGKFVGKAVSFVEKFVSDTKLADAVNWVRVARDKFTDNTERRDFVVNMLVKGGAKEYMARLLVELAVAMMKNDEDKA